MICVRMGLDNPLDLQGVVANELNYGIGALVTDRARGVV
jgi:hypothetical protein